MLTHTNNSELSEIAKELKSRLVPQDCHKIIIAILVIIASSLLLSMPPLILKKIVDIVDFGNVSRAALYAYLGCYVLIIFLGRVLRESQIYVFGPVQQIFQKYFIQLSLESLFKKDFNFYLRKKLGTLTHAITLGENALGLLLQRTYFDVISMSLEIIFSFLILLTLFNLKFSLLFAVFIFSYVSSIVIGAVFVRKYNKAAIHEMIKSKSITTDALYNFESIKIFKLEQHFQDRLSSQIQKQIDTFLKFFKNRSKVGIVQSLILGLFFLVVNLIGLNDYYSKKTSLGFLVMINIYMLQVIKPFEEINLLLRDILTSFDSLKKSAEEIQIKLKTLRLTRDNTRINNIRFKDIYYKDDSNQQLLLKNINIEINRNDKIVVLGANGAGKSTLSRLIAGLIFPTSGYIFLNDKRVSLNALSRLSKIILIPQDPALFNEDIFYNIFLEDTNTPSEASLKMIKELELNELIKNCKENGRILGERGAALSGGERQRVFLLRALIKEADLLVFDEVTSSQDIKKEKKIVNYISKLKYKSVIFITHNWENINSFDKVIFLENGEITFFGARKDFQNFYNQSDIGGFAAMR